MRPYNIATKILFCKVVLTLQHHLQPVQLTLRLFSLICSVTGRQQKVLSVIKTFLVSVEGRVQGIFSI